MWMKTLLVLLIVLLGIPLAAILFLLLLPFAVALLGAIYLAYWGVIGMFWVGWGLLLFCRWCVRPRRHCVTVRVSRPV